MMMKQKKGTTKRLLLAAMLVLACVMLSSCYTDPDDRAFDNGDFNLQGGMNFQTVITNTPQVTATPTPAPTDAPTNTPDVSAGQSDWGDWTWGTDTATNPPSNVVTSAPSQGQNAGTPIVTSPPANTNTGSNTTNNTNNNTSGNSGSSSSSNNTGTTSSSTLRMGSSGAEVKKLQNRLKELKYYNGVVDGDYGQGTYNAVKAFQANNNLTADGVAGPRTLEAIHSYYAVSANTTGAGNGGGGTSSNGNRPSGGSSNNNNQGGTSSGGSSTGTNANSYTNGKTDIYLDLGDTGSQVKIMQNRLIVLGYLTGTANGNFEATTEAAVIAFQKRNGLGADGVAGPGTLTKLYSSSAKKADSVVANLGSLTEGSQGAAVRALQKNLKTLGYYTGSVDGDYGAGTVAAVTAFQAANGLTADGIAGNGTQNAILIALNGGSGSGAGTSSGNNGSSSPVTYGSTATSNGYTTISASNGSSANVSAVQSALSAKGYYSGSLDGDFGSGTQSAVESFQRAQGLRVTGMAGPTTQRLLFGGTAASGSYSKLERGSSGSKVKTLQYALYELKYYDGNITGQYDEATENAVMLFQDCNGLDIDGVAGQMTQQLLYSSNAVPCYK
ncbi:MAG: peptidoglycan-binding protein [Clostridia bacterium]|nr:peptidoglycan-binding protein [Clostridia bacterium]